MKEKLSLGLVAVVCVAFLASGAMAGSVFFSEALDVGQGAAPTDALTVAPGAALTLGIWSSADQDYDTTIGMNVVSSDAGAAALGGAELANPDIISVALGAPVDTRWQDATVGEVTAGQVSNMNAARVTSGTGILGANDGTQGVFKNQDPLLDSAAGAFMLGTVTLTAGAEGSSSVLSINQEGTALFVNAGAQVEPDFMPLTLSVGTASVPEPSTLVLAAFGLMAMLGYGLKR